MEEQNFIFDFNTIEGKDKHIKVTYKDMVVLMEGLNNLKIDISKFETNNIVQKMRFNFKMQEVEKLMNYIEEKTGYNFEKHLNRCKRKNREETGLDGIEAVFKV